MKMALKILLSLFLLSAILLLKGLGPIIWNKEEHIGLDFWDYSHCFKLFGHKNIEFSNYFKQRAK